MHLVKMIPPVLLCGVFALGAGVYLAGFLFFLLTAFATVAALVWCLELKDWISI